MDTCALVTLYKPDSSVKDNIVLLAKQVSAVILIDNTEETDNAVLFTSVDGCTYIWNKENLGLSAAFNKALKTQECTRAADYLLFFDQDSCVTENLVATLVSNFEAVTAREKIGCLGAVYLDSVKNEYGGISKLGNEICENCFEVSEIITSAMITRYAILEDIGFWNEDIFLDYADFDLCWRLREKGYTCFISKNAVLNHRLGTGSLKAKIFGKPLVLSYSSPNREYYQTRAAVKLLLKPYVPFRWKKNFVFNLTLRIWIFCSRLEGGKRRFLYFIKGFADAILHKTGAYKK